MPVRDTRCIAQVGKALHDGLGAATSDAPLAQHGYFAEQVHRDFDAVKQPPLRASRTVEEAFNHAMNLAPQGPRTQRQTVSAQVFFVVTVLELHESVGPEKKEITYDRYPRPDAQ